MTLVRPLACLMLTGLGISALAQAPQAPAPAAPAAAAVTEGISGNWELSYDSRKVPRAKLLPTVTPAKVTQHANLDAHATRWCNLMGLPFVMDSGRPIDIREGPTAVMVVAENVPNPRYLYKGRPHISADIYDPSTLGDSIAHWEGDTLIVDTTNFSNRTTFRGSSENLHLIERFRRVDRDTLLYQVTIQDPTTFTRSWTIEIPAARLDGGIYEYACHEGNYGMSNLLSASRAAEKEAAEGTAAPVNSGAAPR